MKSLRAVALVAAAGGAAGSLVLMHRAIPDPPVFLLACFAVWILSPFVALVLAGIVVKRWSAIVGATLYGLMLFLAAGSPLIYGGVIAMPADTRPAFVFLVVPLVSWLLIAVAVLTAALISRKPPRRGAGA
jgi:hypothetical protein